MGWFSGLVTDRIPASMFLVSSNLTHSKTLFFDTTNITGKYSMRLSVHLNWKKDVIISLACFELPYPSEGPPLSIFSKIQGIKSPKEALFFWILTQDNRSSHLLFCWGSTEQERPEALRRTSSKSFQFIGVILFFLIFFYCSCDLLPHTDHRLMRKCVQHKG